jgi:pimeloyl-ACP methyl ester carboxylesterase
VGCQPATAARPVSGSFDSHGVKIAYSVRGQGEPVVLVHGWLSSGLINWDLPGTSDVLAKDHRVITLDVPGHGLSDKPTNDQAYGPELVEDVVRLMDHLKIEKAHVVGYSMGGIIAANLLAKHPDRVLSGVLGGMGWLREGGLEQRLFGRPGRDRRAAGVCFRSLAKLALTEQEIKSIHVPVLILTGDRDGLKRLYIDPLRSVRKDWPVVEIRDANHLTCILKPQFKEEIQKWLARH